MSSILPTREPQLDTEPDSGAPVHTGEDPDSDRCTPTIAATDLARVTELLSSGGRRILLGLAGPPGAGKSTLAAVLGRAFPETSQVVPMDGFHLAQAELRRLGRADRKGAPDTFDSAGYLSLLQRLRTQGERETDEIVYAPEFRRELEEPIAGAIAVLPGTRLVITEGNYLLQDEGPWARVAALLDDVWYVDVDDAVRTDRLVRRHQRFGRSREDASAWVSGTDAANAALIEASRSRATYFFQWADSR